MTTVASAARTAATTTPTVAELLSRLGFPPSGPGPAWLAQARHASHEWATARGFPTLKDEDWKYTRLGPLLEVPFKRVGDRSGRPVSPEVIDALSIDAASTRLVFVNGFFAPELSSLTALPDGVTVTNLASVLAEGGAGLEPFFSRPLGEYDHAFTALNTALAEDGAFIQVAADTLVSAPIELVFLSDTQGFPIIANPRSTDPGRSAQPGDSRRDLRRDHGRHHVHQRRDPGGPRRGSDRSSTTRSRTSPTPRSISRCSTSARAPTAGSRRAR